MQVNYHEYYVIINTRQECMLECKNYLELIYITRSYKVGNTTGLLVTI